MAIGDVYRLKLIWRKTSLSDAAVNDFYFKQLDALVFDTPGEDLWARFVDEVLPDVQTIVTSILAITQVQVAKAPLFLTEYIVDNPPYGGAATGDALPGRTCGLLAYRTADLSRRGRGRIFLPPSSESFNSASGAPSATYNTQMESLHTALLGMKTLNVLYAGWEASLWSVADQAAKPITEYIVRGYWGNQNDRKNILV